MEVKSEKKNMVAAIQEALREEKLEGWLFFNFRGSNPIASRILDLPSHIVQSRRYFYYVPASGEPRKLVHAIEEGNLDSLPGTKSIYLSWQSLEQGLEAIVKGAKSVAMEYSPRNAIPYVSNVDAGVVELIRGMGVSVTSSANLVQRFEACWSEEQVRDNTDTATHLRQIVDLAFRFIRDRITSGKGLTEYDVQQFMLSEFKKRGLKTDSDPNCSVNANSANPHYEPTKEIHSPIKEGDFVLIDLWAKKDKDGSVYSDITWTGFVGSTVPEEYVKVFEVVRGARDAALERVRQAFANNEQLQGWQVDDAARKVIEDGGFGKYFIHRTGHSIGQEIHGNGANMDNLETRDERRVMPLTSFSIEPGIYLPGKFGIRTEIDVFVGAKGDVTVTGLPVQDMLVPILALT